MVFGHGLKLRLCLRIRLGLILRLPLPERHAVERLSALVFRHLDAALIRRFLIPAAQAVPAKARGFEPDRCSDDAFCG